MHRKFRAAIGLRADARDWIAGLAAGAAFFALAAGFEAKAGEESRPAGRIGEEVSSICFAREIDNWRELRGEDDAVLLERGVNDWYRVELTGGCDARVFRFAQAIAVESRPGVCVGRGDVLIVDDGGFDRRCFIAKINRWDETAPAKTPPADDRV